MAKRPCEVSTFHLTFKYLSYLSDFSVLPEDIPDILLPPHFSTPIFWIAALLYFIGILSFFFSAGFIEKSYMKGYEKTVMYVTLIIGMSDLYPLT